MIPAVTRARAAMGSGAGLGTAMWAGAKMGARMCESPTAVPVTAMPAPAFAVVPAEIYASPASPEMPITTIPKEGATIKPAIVVWTADGRTTDNDWTVVNGVAAIAIIVAGIGVAWSRRIKSWPVIISGPAYADSHTGAAYPDMHTREANADMHLRVRGLRNQHRRACHRGGGNN